MRVESTRLYLVAYRQSLRNSWNKRRLEALVGLILALRSGRQSRLKPLYSQGSKARKIAYQSTWSGRHPCLLSASVSKGRDRLWPCLSLCELRARWKSLMLGSIAIIWCLTTRIWSIAMVLLIVTCHRHLRISSLTRSELTRTHRRCIYAMMERWANRRMMRLRIDTR